MNRKLATLSALFAAGSFLAVASTPAPTAAPVVGDEKKADKAESKCGTDAKAKKDKKGDKDHKSCKGDKDHKSCKGGKDHKSCKGDKDHKSCKGDKKDGQKSCGAGSCSGKKN